MTLDLRLRQALELPRIRSLTTEEILPEVSKLLRQVFVMVGFQHPVAADLSILTSKLAVDLQESYGGLTLQEVGLCFEYGSKGEYGDFRGINLRTLSGWLKNYHRSDRRYQMVAERQKALEQKALPPVSAEYNEQRESVFLENIFRQYRAGVPLDRLFPAQVYRLLQKRGWINDSPEVKWQAIAEAERKYRPGTRLRFPEEIRRARILHEAMTICLHSHFERLVTKDCAALAEGIKK